jgi:hypothetical protein
MDPAGASFPCFASELHASLEPVKWQTRAGEQGTGRHWPRGLRTGEFRQSCLKRVADPCTGFMRGEKVPRQLININHTHFPQLSAQSRHAIGHSSMSPMFSQLSAHASQISTQTREICSLKLEPLNMKFDEVWHISAQFIIRRKCLARHARRPIPGNKSLRSANSLMAAIAYPNA